MLKILLSPSILSSFLRSFFFRKERQLMQERLERESSEISPTDIESSKAYTCLSFIFVRILPIILLLLYGVFVNSFYSPIYIVLSLLSFIAAVYKQYNVDFLAHRFSYISDGNNHRTQVNSSSHNNNNTDIPSAHSPPLEG